MLKWRIYVLTKLPFFAIWRKLVLTKIKQFTVSHFSNSVSDLPFVKSPAGYVWFEFIGLLRLMVDKGDDSWVYIPAKFISILYYVFSDFSSEWPATVCWATEADGGQGRRLLGLRSCQAYIYYIMYFPICLSSEWPTTVCWTSEDDGWKGRRPLGLRSCQARSSHHPMFCLFNYEW